MGWGRGATLTSGSLDGSLLNVNHPHALVKIPENGELPSFILIFILQIFQLYRLLLFWKNKFFGIFSFLDFFRYWKIYPGDFDFFYFFLFLLSIFRLFSKIIFCENNSFDFAVLPTDFFPLVFSVAFRWSVPCGGGLAVCVSAVWSIRLIRGQGF